jgi:hypothetical protein
MIKYEKRTSNKKKTKEDVLKKANQTMNQTMYLRI